uniref:Uncharacterized protein n=1 Tax=Candidatus Kentrum sp. UNK TaxID=2126344 RepID=A0A451B5M2_9GAMM|nr:MAG: hypothetical protein BECKUNK1418G_GA0071005_12372 [Candidatus Kentron sp. UNK]VFK73588.1 MAG: hypothetical protein BECKUNK1418H_GA0071006_12252 [Candidatus Kentron sp. UNK]
MTNSSGVHTHATTNLLIFRSASQMSEVYQNTDFALVMPRSAFSIRGKASLVKYFVDGPRAQHLLGPIQQGVDIGFIDTLTIGIREFFTELCLQ